VDKKELGIVPVLIWIGAVKTADNISTMIMVDQLGWAVEQNLLIGLVHTPVTKLTVLWPTLPIGLAIAYFLYRHPILHPALEIFIVLLTLVPFSNLLLINFSHAPLILLGMLSLLFVRYCILEIRNQGLKAFYSFDPVYLPPLFFEFKSAPK
jgi:hypothetical protein